MYMNMNCDNPNEFVTGQHGALIQRKFLREEDPQKNLTELIKTVVDNESLRELLVRKAEMLNITPEEAISRALNSYLK